MYHMDERKTYNFLYLIFSEGNPIIPAQEEAQVSTYNYNFTIL